MQILSDIIIHSASSLETLLPCVDDRSPLTQPWTITLRKLAANVIVIEQGQQLSQKDSQSSFSVKSLTNSLDLRRIYELSQDKNLWRNLIAKIYKIDEDENSYLRVFESMQS